WADLPSTEGRDGVMIHRLPAVVRVGNAPVLPGLLGALGGHDVIHLHSPFILGAELVCAAAALHRIPFVLTHHNDLIGEGLRGRMFTLYSAFSNRLVLRAARKVAVVSLDHARSCRLANRLQGRWADVVEVPNGVDTGLFRPDLEGTEVRRRHGLPAGARVVGFVGALDAAHHFKGLPHLLKAFTWLEDPSAVLLVVGDGDLRPRLERLAGELNLGERVRFVGAVAHDKLPAYYAALDLLVLPSSPPESFGMVLIEAMACGKPVVAQDIPGVRSVVNTGIDGLLARPGDAADLAAKVGFLLADQALRGRMGRAGRRKVEERYSWSRIGAGLEGMYRQVLGLGPERGMAATLPVESNARR
ncbi:MAG: glycosyltransferase family 4 protein, partial [Chloroflexota bacterium]